MTTAKMSNTKCWTFGDGVIRQKKGRSIERPLRIFTEGTAAVCLQTFPCRLRR